MSNTMKGFTDRVTMGEDGIYRWYYDIDLQTNRYMRNLVMKAVGAAFGIAVLMLMFLLAADNLLTATAAAIILGVYAGILGITFGIFEIVARVKKVSRTLYMMGDNGIAQAAASRENTAKAIHILTGLNVVAGIAAGSPVQALMYGAYLEAGASGTAQYMSRFISIGNVREDPLHDSIHLNAFMQWTQICVPKEDYQFVCDFIRARTER